jgi:polysaccharide biosynthesis/export protein
MARSRTDSVLGQIRTLFSLGRIGDRADGEMLEWCYLEGLTHEEAANRLRLPVGTVRSRLARGRDRLRDRLTRRGLAPSLV